MKTYKQMAENVLKRRDEYFDKKAKRKTAGSAVPAIVAASVMVVVMLFGTIIGSVMRNPTPPAATGEASDNMTVEMTSDAMTEEITTEDMTDETTAAIPETDITTERIETLPGQVNEDEKKYPMPIEFVPDSDSDIVIDVKNDPDIYGIECENLITYQMQYNTRRDFGRECGNRVRLLILPSSSIELLSPDVLTLDISENDSVEFELVFKYADGNSRGTFRIFSVEDLYWDIDNNYKSVSELPELIKDKDFQMIFTEERYGAVRTKGYDFFSGIWDTTTIYYCIARYYGEVDDEGNPLFLSDPYMPDYYDCETCQRLRQQIEEREKFNREHSAETNGISSMRNYDITVCGYVRWTDGQGNLHPAKNLTVRLKDQNNVSIDISTTTNDTGYYKITYPLSVSGNYNLIISCETSGLAIIVRQSNGACPLKKDIAINCTSSETRIIFFDFAPGLSDTDEESVLNNAVSIHQACELIQRYFYQLTGTYIPQVIVSLCMNYYIEDNLEARYYKEQEPCTYNLYVSYKDAFDWDKIEYEYAHYIEDLYGMYFYNYYVNKYDNLAINSSIGKENGTKYAWQDGWAIFFAVNAQRKMNASNLNLNNVGDTYYTDFGSWHDNDINFDVENFVLYYPTNTTISKCEANVLTVAALMYDFCDPVNLNDHDKMYYNNTIIWYISAFANHCKSLSEFMQHFRSSSLSVEEKLKAGWSLEWFEISPTNVYFPYLSLGVHYLTWSNPSSNYYNKVYIYDSSYNILYQSSLLTYQSNYFIDNDTWNSQIAGAGDIYFCVDGIQSDYPITGPYSSSAYHLSP